MEQFDSWSTKGLEIRLKLLKVSPLILILILWMIMVHPYAYLIPTAIEHPQS